MGNLNTTVMLRRKIVLLPLAATILLGSAVGVRALLRQDQDSDAATYARTGVSVPLQIGQLVPGVTVEGMFECHEVREYARGEYSAEATGGKIVNATDHDISVEIKFTAQAGGETHTVRHFAVIHPGSAIRQLYFVQVEDRQSVLSPLPPGLSACRIDLESESPSSELP